jgi:SNF2 family DNA or RNA helicase
MLDTGTSLHSVGLRDSPFKVWGYTPFWSGDSQYPNLNTSYLLAAIRPAIDDGDASEEEVSEGEGKKRSRSNKHSRKKRKTSLSPSPDVEISPYPYCPAFQVDPDSHTRLVMRHTFLIDYTLNTRVNSSLAVESELAAVIDAIDAPRELPKVDVREYSKRLVLFQDGRWLSLLPNFPVDSVRDWETLDYFSADGADFNTAIIALANDGRLSIGAQATISARPEGSYNPEREYPLLLTVQLNISFTDKIFEPHPALNALKGKQLRDAQRRLLHYIYPSNLPDVHAENGPDIPFFYSVLGPADQEVFGPKSVDLQPPALLPTLLPFQRRSVAWLLEREGMTMGDEGDVVPKKTDPFSFWIKVEEGGDTFYVHRLTGMAAQNLDNEPEEPRGAMLCEEPGLGKTIEMISLILLSPAPPERNPSVTRWDNNADLEVRAIKVSIAVLPAANSVILTAV